MKQNPPKTIGIVTIESQNYGNRLQNYALQEALSALGYASETLRRQKRAGGAVRFARSVVQAVLSTKAKKFRDFEKKIRKSPYFASADEAPEDLASRYDLFVAGSDQIWNPHYGFVGSVDFLSFAPPAKRIAYAASFGVSELPDAVKDRYAAYLGDFRALSVRETEGAAIVRALTGAEAKVVPDPTLLLTAERWRGTERKPPALDREKYVLVYALGEKNDAFRRAVAEAGDAAVDVLRIMPDGREWAVGPMEFLWLIDHAETVLTDSFHCTVFSVLFHTRFQVFDRPGLSMSSRIVTLLKSLGLPDGADPMDPADQLRFDFSGADAALERLRANAFRYLEDAFRRDPS